MKKTVFTALALVAMAAPCSAVELAFEDDFPIVGRTETVTVEGAGPGVDLSLWVIYSPNSETSTEEKIGLVPATGEVEWSPSRSGIATVSVRGDEGTVITSENVAIIFAETPMAGVMVMIFAGLLLFGGAGYSLRSVLRSGVPEIAPLIDT
jgi:hypothetical protein